MPIYESRSGRKRNRAEARLLDQQRAQMKGAQRTAEWTRQQQMAAGVPAIVSSENGMVVAALRSTPLVMTQDEAMWLAGELMRVAQSAR